MIKAILFDVDGVLVDSFAANLDFFQRFMKKLDYKEPSKEQYKKLFHLTLEAAVNELSKETDSTKIQKISKLAIDRIVPYRNDLLQAPSGLLAVIQELSQKYILGIVTSRRREVVFSLPILEPLKNFFKVTICFEDVKRCKPDPEPLFLACQTLGIEPSEAIYIGDAPTDIVAAKAASMRNILYTDSNPDLIGADHKTNDFTKIPDLIRQMSEI